MHLKTPGWPTIQFESPDVEEVREDPAQDARAPVVVLYADLPVHTSMLGREAGPDGFPFLEMSKLWKGRTAEYASRSQTLNELIENLAPTVRRLASLFQQDDMQHLAEALAHLPIADVPEIAKEHPIYQLGRMVDLLFMAFSDVQLRTSAANELIELMMRARRKHPVEYRALLARFVGQCGFLEHRRRVIEVTAASLAHADAVLPGLAWEHVAVKPRPDPNDFRIVRGDFDALRARYVDIFELGSRSLGYEGALANLATRNAADEWSNGKTKSLETLLRDRAVAREFILAELPVAKRLYNAVNRTTRNQFGHYAIEYDPSSGELVDQEGRRTSFLLFMVDYLAAVRLSWFLYGVAEKISLECLDVDSPHRRVEEELFPDGHGPRRKKRRKRRA